MFYVHVNSFPIEKIYLRGLPQGAYDPMVSMETIPGTF